MTLRIFISMVLIGLFGIQWIGFSYAQDDGDREYVLQTQEDMLGTNDSDDFMQLEKTVEKTLVDPKIIKWAHIYAQDYLFKMEPYDSDWTAKSPKLLGKAVPYYTDDTSEPLGYEWKVQCVDNKDCGSILVYAIEGEYTLLQASTTGKANYERILTDKKSKKNKLYYYSPVDQYVESSDGKDTVLDAINPDQKGIITKDVFDGMKKVKKQKRDEMKKQKLSKKDLQNSLFSISDAGIVSGGTLPCGSVLPCYSQYNPTTASPSCMTGCVPTAMSIIFGYYDRNNLKPNLLPGTASDTLMDKAMSDTIRTYMKTRCVSGTGANQPGSTGLVTMPDGIKYAKDKWYTNSTTTLQAGSNLWFYIRSEIKAGRPVMINIQSSMANGHTMAWYAYTQNGLTVDSVKVNVGWGSGQPDFYMPINSALANQVGNLGLLNNMQITSILQINVQ